MSPAQLSCHWLLLISAQMHLGLATPLLKGLPAYEAQKGYMHIAYCLASTISWNACNLLSLLYCL